MTHVSTALLVTRDLFFSSSIEGVARAAGVTLRIAAGLPAPDDEIDFELLILDLELPSLDFAELARLIQSHEFRAVAYGSHVKTHLFDAARESGLEHLVSRGQIGKRLPEFLR